jgi:hypothetical protein
MLATIQFRVLFLSVSNPYTHNLNIKIQFYLLFSVGVL